MKSTVKAIVRKLRRLFCSEIYMEEIREEAPSTPTQKYICVFFLEMCKKGLGDFTLFANEPLPIGFEGFDDALFEGVSYGQVTDRIREMITSYGPDNEPYIDLVICDRAMTCLVEICDDKCHLTLEEKRPVPD